jgi:hypothetical protein
MPETGGANIEIAHHLNEADEHRHAHAPSRLHLLVEVCEAIILALVAITTAWSGYQAARFDSVQSELYGRSSRLRIEAQALDLEANQKKAFNAAIVDEWLKAEVHGETKLIELFERRVLPEFRPALEAWKKTDPVHNRDAPPGPFFMPEYRDFGGEQGKRKNQDASELFERGTHAREYGDEYVRVTVFLATVLLLIAIGQRFRSHRIRVALVTIAMLMLSVPIWRLLGLPRM